MPSTRALAAGVLCSTALGLLPSLAFADTGELISRRTGADGAAIADPGLVTATRNGRFILFRGPYSEAASAPASSRFTLFLRDRETDVTTPVMRADGELGEVWSDTPDSPGFRTYYGLDVSPDGTKVLFAGPKQGDAVGSAVYLRDLTAGTTTVVSTLPSGEEAVAVAGAARLVRGGTAVVYGARTLTGDFSTYTRELPSGTATVFTAGVEPRSVSADGNVMTWVRQPAPANRPAGSGVGVSDDWPAQMYGFAAGYTEAGKTPVVASRTIIKETAKTKDATCPTAGGTTKRIDPSQIIVSDSGTKLWFYYTGTPPNPSDVTQNYWTTEPATEADIASPSHGPYGKSTTEIADIGEAGVNTLSLSNLGYSGVPGASVVYGFPAGTPAPAMPVLPPYGYGYSASSARFFAGDSGVILQDTRYGTNGDPAVTGIYAYDPVRAPGASPAAGTPTVPGSFPDGPSTTPLVTWADCAPTPVGTADQYAKPVYNTPFTSKKSAGTVGVLAAPAGVRAASKTTLTVKTFFWTTWSQTVETGEKPTITRGVTLPKPMLFLPQTLTIETTVPATATAPAVRVKQSRSWQVWK